MRCYYEELGVPQDAAQADIKSAYRKLALSWHPDKNLDCLTEANEKFLLIQQAYEVLSDPQERAWYDNHRDQILRGKNSEYEETNLDVFQYFASSCYKGYGDDKKSFYSVYREVFQKLATEDAEFMDDAAEIGAIPSFGKSDSSYQDVVGPFYAYWQSYSTKKTYEWLCPYNILEIKDRYILRKVEKEMKKIVQKARKERNDEVRNLVSFIRKRDRRLHAYRRQLEERAELNRQKQAEKRKEQLRKRQEDLAAAQQNKSAFNENYEEQLKQLEQEYDSESRCDDDENSSVEANNENHGDLYCVACNKSFKNVNAFANHEDSKKHRENVERLRLEMDQDDEEAYEANSRSENSPIEPTKTKKNKKSMKSSFNQLLIDDNEDELIVLAAQQNMEKSDDDEDWSSNRKAGKRNKVKKQPTTLKRESQPAMEAPPRKAARYSPVPAYGLAYAMGLEHFCGVCEYNFYGPEFICDTCGMSFVTERKLIAHLKKTKHTTSNPNDVSGKQRYLCDFHAYTHAYN